MPYRREPFGLGAERVRLDDERPRLDAERTPDERIRVRLDDGELPDQTARRRLDEERLPDDDEVPRHRAARLRHEVRRLWGRRGGGRRSCGALRDAEERSAGRLPCGGRDGCGVQAYASPARDETAACGRASVRRRGAAK